MDFNLTTKIKLLDFACKISSAHHQRFFLCIWVMRARMTRLRQLESFAFRIAGFPLYLGHARAYDKLKD